MALRAGAVLGGKYVVDRLIGTGGMGSVWQCRHATLDAPFAVKVLRPELVHDDDARARFDREAKASATLRTRHVVKVHDHGVDGELLYIVMELLEGEDLRSRMQRLGRLGRRATCQVVVQAARGLHYAHAAGIVHRDLKPANIFLANIDGEEVVKILDFGIAKTRGSPQAGAATQTGALLGSPHYMSPEQIRGHWSMVDHRTDLWALGVVAFRALTGQLPFLGDIVGDVMVKVCIDPIPRASAIAPDLPPEIDEFFARALARDRDQRYRSGLELAAGLARALGEPLDTADPAWLTPTPSEKSVGPALVEDATVSTRRLPRAAPTEGSLDLANAVTRRATPDGAGPPSPLRVAEAAGTLTEAGSLQASARRELPRQPLLWVVAGVLVAVVGSGALLLERAAEPPPLAIPALGRAAAVVASAVLPVRSVAGASTEPSSLPATAPSASAAGQAAPIVTASAPAAGAARQPAAKGRPDGFRDRFGYE